MAESIFRFQRPQGAEILVESEKQMRSCSVGFWVKRGSVDEGPSEEGLAHFIEHAVFKGTQRYPDPERLSSATDALGGSLDAFTGKEAACFYGKVLPDQLPSLIDILGDLVTTPRFDAEELARERAVILEEIAQSEDQPDDWVSELFYMNFWKGGPLAHPILGRPDQISAYEPEAVRAYFKKTYTAPNLLICAAGHVDPDGFLELLQPILDRLPKEEPETAPAPSAQQPFLINQPRKALQQASLIMGFPAPGHQHPDRVALNLVSHVLGGGMSSRLFMALREKHALCYSIGSYLTQYREGGALQIAASCAQEKARDLVQRACEECRRLAEKGATQSELDRAKLQARTTLVFGQESTSARMFTLAHQAIHMDRIRSLDEQIFEIDQLDLETFNRVARQTLSERPSLAALGTPKSGEIRASDLA